MLPNYWQLCQKWSQRGQWYWYYADIFCIWYWWWWNEAPSKSKEENDKRAVELQGFEKNIGDAQQAAQQEFQKKQAELFAPISEKAKAAIEKVAAAQGFDYVIDAQAGGGLGRLQKPGS